MYEPHLEFTGSLEKKVTFGIWSKKFVTFKGLTLVVSDVENGPAILTLELIGLSRVEGDTTAMQFNAKGQELVLRGADQRIADYWWDLVTSALVHHKLLKPRSAGLPPIDPRFNLKFAEIPSEFVQRFEKLDKCVLYWFSPVKKYGAVSKLTRRHTVEDRVGCCGDKAFYITKHSSDLTRCIKIVNLKRLYTNYQTKADPKDESFVVLKTNAPDFDLYISSPTVDVLVRCLEALYTYYSKGTPLEVIHTKSIVDVELQLERPANFNQTMLVPTSKEQLKKAFDSYGRKNGIKFTQSGVEAADPLKSPSLGSASVSSSVNSPKGSFAAPGDDDSPEGSAGLPATDPLAVFLSFTGMAHIYLGLYKQSIDLDIMECMDENDIKGFGGVTDAEAARLKKHLGDATLMSNVRAKVEQARTKAKWGAPAEKGQTDGGNGTAAGKVSSPQVPQAAARPANAPIILDDDDDDLDALVAQTSMSKAPVFEFNDSDDDLALPPAAAPKPAAPIVLDDDDDL
jgi:hypothetical protein